MLTVILQARMGSSRLPGKALMEIKGKTMTQWCIERICKTEMIQFMGQLVVALPEGASNDRLHDHIREITKDIPKPLVHVFRGSEEDVLGRFYEAAEFHDATTIIRITGDCPLIDPVEITNCLGMYSFSGKDFVTNRPGYPDGFDVQIFDRWVLQRVHENATRPEDREHVCTYMTEGNGFSVFKIVPEVPYPKQLEFSVDTRDDLERVRDVVRHYGEDFGVVDVPYYCEKEGIA